MQEQMPDGFAIVPAHQRWAISKQIRYIDKEIKRQMF